MEKRIPGIILSVISVLILIVNVFIGVQYLGASPHIPMLASGIIVIVIAMKVLGYTWSEVEEGIIKVISNSMGAILILIVVGTVVSSWMLSGVVPSMIYYGLQILSPKIFLVSALLICSVISLSLGSSWTTVSTVGIALMGTGMGLGIPVPVIGGAIISGSYFGDKMSPLSDTTNLAPGIAGSSLFEHIRHMIYTVLPSYIISMIIFGFLGMKYGNNSVDQVAIVTLMDGIKANFHISPLLFLVPAAVIALVALKVPSILALFCGSLLGGAVAVLVQGETIATVVDVLHYGFYSDTGNAVLDELLSRGGLHNMMWTVSLILCALVFAGVLEKTGMINTIAQSLLGFTKTRGSLVATTIATAIGVNITTGEQYLSIVVPGTMFKDEYARKNLHPKNLSRVLEDAGTLTSPLIPWNGCGAFMIATLGLTPWTYVPFCFLNIINPLVSLVYGYTGITMEEVGEREEYDSGQVSQV